MFYSCYATSGLAMTLRLYTSTALGVDFVSCINGITGNGLVCGMPAGIAYPSGHLVPPPIVGLACAPIVETRFFELAMSLLDFSPRIPLGTFSILLVYNRNYFGIVLFLELCYYLIVVIN